MVLRGTVSEGVLPGPAVSGAVPWLAEGEVCGIVPGIEPGAVSGAVPDMLPGAVRKVVSGAVLRGGVAVSGEEPGIIPGVWGEAFCIGEVRPL